MLNLDFTPEQDMLREAVRGLCGRLSPLERVRELEDDPDGIARELWDQLGELGLCGLIVPESLGGSDMSLIDGVVVYEELGRALAPVPHFVSCVLSAAAIVAAGGSGGDPGSPTSPGRGSNGPPTSPGSGSRGDPAGGSPSGAAAELLAEIASGAAIVTPAWLEPGGGFAPKGVRLTTAEPGADGGFKLDGVKLHVVFAAAAHHLLVLARTGPAPAEVDLFLVPAGADGLAMEQCFSIASDTQYVVGFDEVELPAESRLGAAGAGWGIWERAMAAGAVLAAAQAVGGAEHALEITAEYARNRHQFGKALAEFQAISHYLADARTNLDGARILVHQAAWAHSTGRDISRLAPMAKLFACRVFRDITAMAQQVFGGLGFTVDYDIQLYFRRAKQLQLSWWDTQTCEDKIANAVLGPVGPFPDPAADSPLTPQNVVKPHSDYS